MYQAIRLQQNRVHKLVIVPLPMFRYLIKGEVSLPKTFCRGRAPCDIPYSLADGHFDFGKKNNYGKDWSFSSSRVGSKFCRLLF